MAKESEKKASAKLFEMVSFRLAIELYEKLETYASTQRDPESGTVLSPSQAARRLLAEALEASPKKKS